MRVAAETVRVAGGKNLLVVKYHVMQGVRDVVAHSFVAMHGITTKTIENQRRVAWKNLARQKQMSLFAK